MKADLSRDTFRHLKHFSRLVGQQGRVTDEADWNNQVDIHLHRERTTMRDVIGQSGVPEVGGGFSLIPTDDKKDLFILPGRLYLDGIFCEAEASEFPFSVVAGATNQTIPAIWSPEKVDFAALQWIEIYDEVATGAPLLFQVSAADPKNKILTLTPSAGNSTDLATFLKSATEPRMRRRFSATVQPDLPGGALPKDAGRYFGFLHVFERHLTGLDDPEILETALNGVDTCTRAKVVWQVMFLKVGDVGSTTGCGDSVAGWDTLVAPGTGELSARSQPDATASSPCIVPAKAGYRRLENQLYRVEIHDGGTLPGNVTFKWSRDNGSVVTKWTGTDGNNLSVSSAGRESTLGFAPGQWIELFSDEIVLEGAPGTLVPLIKVAGLTLTIDPTHKTGSVDPKDFPTNPELRRWDSPGPIAAAPGVFQALEDGVEVQFSAGTYHSGDYWMIPARSITGDVEWRRDDAGNPLPSLPHGIRHHHARLAVLEFDGTVWTLINDCRPQFPPLTAPQASGPEPGIHVTDIRIAGAPAGQHNDMFVQPIQLTKGIQVRCDDHVDPLTVKRPTCFLSVEIPFPAEADAKQLWGDAISGYQQVILDVVPKVDGNIILWSPPQNVQLFLQRLQNFINEIAVQPLARFTLKGNFIWAQEKPDLFLDGEVFGIRRAGGTETEIRLPSGNGRRGGDLEIWFWLGRAPAPPVRVLANFAIKPQSVKSGAVVQLTANLDGPAPAGGADVAIIFTVQDAAGAVVPGVNWPALGTHITIAENQSSGVIQGKAPKLPAGSKATFTFKASFGGQTKEQRLVVAGTG